MNKNIGLLKSPSKTPGYGTDEYCDRARSYIRKSCDDKNADVHFLVGGTQANTTIISSILRPHQGVVSAITGHIQGMKREQLRLLYL